MCHIFLHLSTSIYILSTSTIQVHSGVNVNTAINEEDGASTSGASGVNTNTAQPSTLPLNMRVISNFIRTTHDGGVER